MGSLHTTAQNCRRERDGRVRHRLACRTVLAAYAARIDPEDPLSGLEIDQMPEPDPPPGWEVVEVRACALNHHDLWALRGVGLAESQLPMILGCDAAGIDSEGREVMVHAVITQSDWRGEEVDDPKRTILSEHHPGTFAERVAVPPGNAMPKPQSLSFAEAACLPTVWLTAYRMLFTKGRLRPGQTVLVQGASGGVVSAAISLAATAGARVWATARTEAKRERALELGADAAFESGERLPERVDLVIETVGEATWSHSLRALKPAGRIVISGNTSGPNPPAELQRIFFRELQVIGSTMGTRDELADVARLFDNSDLRPIIDRTLPLTEAREGFAAMDEGDIHGKVVFTL